MFKKLRRLSLELSFSVWPLFLVIFSISAWNYLPGNYKEITPVFSGVLLAFWLDYIFRRIVKKKSDDEKRINALYLFKQELFFNRRALLDIADAINSAIEKRVIASRNVMESISTLSEDISSKTFYAMQSSGWFEVLDNKELVAQMINAYAKTSSIKTTINFLATRLEEERASDKNTENALIKIYNLINLRCLEDKEFLKSVIGAIDKELLDKHHRVFTIKADLVKNSTGKTPPP